VESTSSGDYALSAADGIRDLRSTCARRKVMGKDFFVTPTGDDRFRIIITPERDGATVTSAAGVGFGDRVR